MKRVLLIVFIQIFVFSIKAYSQSADISKINIPKDIKAINCITIENDNIIWVGTNKGLLKVVDSTVTVFYDIKKPAKYKINKITIDDSGVKWLGTYQSSIIRFEDFETAEEISFLEKTDNKFQLISSISNYKDDILVTTSEGLIIKYNHKLKSSISVSSPTSTTIYSSLFDGNGNFWICTSEGLFSKSISVDWKKEKMMRIAYGIYRKNDEFWAAGRGSDDKTIIMLLFTQPGVFKKEQSVWQELILEGLPNSYARINYLSFDIAEMIWIASGESILMYNPFVGSAREICSQPLYPFKEVSVISCQGDSENLIWFVANGNELYKLIYR